MIASGPFVVWIQMNAIGPLMELIDAKDVQDLSKPILLANLIKTVKRNYAQIQSETKRNLWLMNISDIRNLKREQILSGIVE